VRVADLKIKEREGGGDSRPHDDEPRGERREKKRIIRTDLVDDGVRSGEKRGNQIPEVNITRRGPLRAKGEKKEGESLEVVRAFSFNIKKKRKEKRTREFLAFCRCPESTDRAGKKGK